MAKKSVFLMAALLLSLVQPTRTLGQATPTVFRFSNPFNQLFTNPCGTESEIINITGVAETVVTIVGDSASGFHFTMHSHAKGNGVGLTSGKQYKLLNQDSSTTTSNGSCQFEASLTQETILLSKGESPNARFRLMTRAVFDANCKPSVSIDLDEIICQGE
jgi:hypothetical protein